MSKKSSKCLKFLKNVSENTYKSYLHAIRKYEKYNNLSMENLVKEALDEQSSNTPTHKLSIIDRLEDYQEYLINQDLVHGTINAYMTRIKSVYYKNRVSIPYLEPLNPKRTKRRDYIEYSDILTKEEIKKCLPHMRLPAQARALTIIQGGLSNEECEHLTLTNFLNDTFKYHKCTDPVEALNWLADENHPIIWVAKLIRVKTGKPYYAVIGAEAVNMIAKAKLYEKELPKNHNKFPEKLLGMSKDRFTRTCQSTNNKVGLGLVADCSKFRSHNLRRFHATYIKGSALTYEENSRLSNNQIDELQGRGKTSVQDTYIKTNPLEQKLLYAKVMNNVSLFHEYDYEFTGDDVVIFIKDQFEVNRKLAKKVSDLELKLHQREVAGKRVKELKEELGDDVFSELISEILSNG